jgi:hypothetical protein
LSTILKALRKIEKESNESDHHDPSLTWPGPAQLKDQIEAKQRNKQKKKQILSGFIILALICGSIWFYSLHSDIPLTPAPETLLSSPASEVPLQKIEGKTQKKQIYVDASRQHAFRTGSTEPPKETSEKKITSAGEKPKNSTTKQIPDLNPKKFKPMAEVPAKTETPVTQPMTEVPVKTEAPVSQPMAEVPIKMEVPVSQPMTEVPIKTEAPVSQPMAEVPIKTEVPVTQPTAEVSIKTGVPAAGPDNIHKMPPQLEEKKDERIHLQAIAWSPDPESSFVLINNRLFHEGDNFEGIIITRIGKEDVSFKENGVEWQERFRRK